MIHMLCTQRGEACPGNGIGKAAGSRAIDLSLTSFAKPDQNKKNSILPFGRGQGKVSFDSITLLAITLMENGHG